MAAPHKLGVLLVNLGTPASPETDAVRAYLREFLSDPRVVDISPVSRWMLVNLVVAPFRAPRTAAAYQKIWTANGSPLLVHCEAMRAAIAHGLRGREIEIALGMRYGRPSIADALAKLRDLQCERVLVFPLYPQYAASSTASALETVYRCAGEYWDLPFLTVVPPFWDDDGFLDAWEAVARPVLKTFAADQVLFSFHGIPERHVLRSDRTHRHCLTHEHCCDSMMMENRNCYRAQCFATARAIAHRLGLMGPVLVSFQSRMGRTPWIRPFTDEVLPALADRGKRRVAVLCPSFTADCLETLEEIGIRARADFRAAGGDDLRLVPSLNAHPAWIAAATALIERYALAPAGPFESPAMPDGATRRT